MVVPRLPEHWSKFLLNQGETGMDYQVVDVTLRDGRIVRDVAIIHSELVGEVRGHSDIPFHPADIVDIKVMHNKCDFQKERQQ
jgi:hypothetical protein